MAGQEDRGVQGTEGVHQAADPGGVHPGEGLCPADRAVRPGPGPGPGPGGGAFRRTGEAGKLPLLAGELGQGPATGDLRPAGLGSTSIRCCSTVRQGNRRSLLKEKGKSHGEAGPGSGRSGGAPVRPDSAAGWSCRSRRVLTGR